MIKVNLKLFRYEQPECANRYHKSVFDHQTCFLLVFFLIYVDWKFLPKDCRFFWPTPLFLAHCITLLSKLWFSWKLGLTVADLWIGSSLLCQVFFSLTVILLWTRQPSGGEASQIPPASYPFYSICYTDHPRVCRLSPTLQREVNELLRCHTTKYMMAGGSDNEYHKTCLVPSLGFRIWAVGSHGHPTQTHWEQRRICFSEQVTK